MTTLLPAKVSHARTRLIASAPQKASLTVSSITDEYEDLPEDWEDIKEKKSDINDKKIVGPRLIPALRLSGLQLGGRGKNGRKMAYLRTKLHFGGTLNANTVAAKYLVQLGGNVTYDINQIQNSVEWSSFNTVFEEFFVHSMLVKYEPNNQFTTGMNTSTINIEDGAMTIAGYQHNQPPITDSAHAYQDLMNSVQSKFTNTARPWSFVWRNIDKFDKNGPGGDGTTATNSQQWLNIGSVAKLGGFVSIASAIVTAAAASSTAYVINYQFGYYVVQWDVSFRYRD